MTGTTIKKTVHFATGRHTRKEIHTGPTPEPVPARIPRVAKLMALAIRFDQLVRDGHVADYAELASLGHVTRARLTQIMNLLTLAPEIQEAILFLPPVECGKDPTTERGLRMLMADVDWGKQRGFWNSIRQS